MCPVASVERPFCSCFWGDRDSGVRACACEGGVGASGRNCGLHGVHSRFLPGLFLSPLTPAFFFYIPNAHPAWDGFISNSHPVQKGLLFRCYVLSRAERNFPEGSALTFCTYSLLPIRAFVHKNANRPEIDCISKCHREARCIFSRYG